MRLSELEDKVNRLREEASGDPEVLVETKPARGVNHFPPNSVTLFSPETEEEANRVTGLKVGEEVIIVTLIM